MLTVRWADTDGLRRFEEAMKALGDARLRQVANRAVNRAGDMARTQVRSVLPKQTGLKRRTIVKAVHVSRSNPGTLVYTMAAKGGDVSLKYFGPRETRRGVSAAPFGNRQIFAGMFVKGGRFPNRVAINMGGHVFKRVGSKRTPIALQDSGVIIPAEMVKGATARAFETTVGRVLPQRMEHEIRRVTKGEVS
ncbi:MAG: hypothetical protein AB7F74_29810 [Parvibaculaceae bacterium]